MTWARLIPKFKGALEIKDYKPISMVSCLYKVIMTIQANRLRNVMGGLVDETQ